MVRVNVILAADAAVDISARAAKGRRNLRMGVVRF
jgi:hypothetical protein